MEKAVNPLSVRTQKAALRKRIEALRSSIGADERRRKSEVICGAAARLLEYAAFRKTEGDRTLFTYVPIRAEVDVRPLIEWCWSRRIRVVVPKVIRERNAFSLHAIERFDDLEPGVWGIPEPKPSAPALPDVRLLDAVIVPGVAFDPRGGRLGYGGGYYDRFMRLCREEGADPYKLALAFDVQIVPEIPMDAHDFRVDAIVTESRTIFAADALS